MYEAGLLASAFLGAIFPLASAQQLVCNNSPNLCDRAYNNITHLGAHDSPFVRNQSNDFTPTGDEFFNSIDALDAGVRLLSGQIHKVNPNEGPTEYHLCHTNCNLYDAGKVSDWLTGLNSWLDRNPNDVITILLVNSDNLDALTLGPIFTDTRIDQRAYQPNDTTKATSDWPTLSDMIRQDKRLVAFIASLDPTRNQAAPYLLDEFTFIFENPYDYSDPTTFSCDPDRPSTFGGNASAALSTERMPFMNHFLYDKLFSVEVPSVENVEKTNSPDISVQGSLGASAANCTNVYATPPKFLLVDFFNVGPALTTVDQLNGVSGSTTGRKILPTTVAGSMNDPAVSSSPVSSAPVVSNAPASSASNNANGVVAQLEGLFATPSAR